MVKQWWWLAVCERERERDRERGRFGFLQLIKWEGLRVKGVYIHGSSLTLQVWPILKIGYYNAPPLTRISSLIFDSDTVLDSSLSFQLLVIKSILIPVDATTARWRYGSLYFTVSSTTSPRWLSVFPDNFGSHLPECLPLAQLWFHLRNPYTTETRETCYESAVAPLLTPKSVSHFSDSSYNFEWTNESRP